MKHPARNVLYRSVEKSIERIPHGTSYINDELGQVSAYKSLDRTAVEHNELLHFGHCVTDIQVVGGDDSRVIQYAHTIEKVEVHSFKGKIDELSLLQLGKVAINLRKLSGRLEGSSSTLDS